MRPFSFACVCCPRTFTGFAFTRDKLGEEARAAGWRLQPRQLRAGVVYEWRCAEHALPENVAQSASQTP